MARTRITRSSSREVSNEPLPRRTRAQSRQASVESAVQTENTSALNTRRNPRLETLPEDESEAEDDDSPLFEPVENESVRSTSRLPGQSASPSQPSYSQTELAELNPDEMVEQLSDLNHQATQLLGHYNLFAADIEAQRLILREVEDTTSKRRQRIDKRWQELEPTMDAFGKMASLDREIVLRSLLGVESTELLPNKSWRPDDLIYKANLAKFVHQLTTKHRTYPQMVEWINSWNQEFPKSLVLKFAASSTHLGAGQSGLIRQTLSLGLELRTHLAITALVQIEDPDAEEVDETIRGIMLSDDSDENLVEALALSENARGWELLPSPQSFRFGNVSFAEQVVSRAQEIRDLVLYTDEESIDIGAGLRKAQEQFPWEDLKLHLLRWARLRVSEIDQSISRLGGAEPVRASLEKERERRTNDPNAPEEADDVVPRPPVGNSATPAPTNASSRVEARPRTVFKVLKNLKSSISKHPPSSVRTAQEQGSRTADNMAPTQIESNELAIEHAQSGFSARPTRVARERPTLTNGPKKAFVEPQPDGKRIVFDEFEQPTQPESTGQRGGFRLPAHQQPRNVVPSVEGPTQNESEVEDPSEDEGFENDNRSIPAPSRQRRTPLVQETQEDPVDDLSPISERRRSATGTPPSPKRQRKNPGQTIEPYVPSGQHLADLATQAAQGAKMRRRQMHKPSRTRNPWTNDETARLIDYIKEHGTSWSNLKTIDVTEGGDVLHFRSAEDLRFKARNVKVDFLLSELPLPENFEKVYLGQKELDVLERNGVHYEQGRVRGTRGGDISD